MIIEASDPNYCTPQPFHNSTTLLSIDVVLFNQIHSHSVVYDVDTEVNRSWECKDFWTIIKYYGKILLLYRVFNRVC